MKFQILLEDIVYEHRIPVKSGEQKDALDLAGGETIDLSNLSRENLLRTDVKHIGGNGLVSLHTTDEEEMVVWRVAFTMSETSNTPPSDIEDGGGYRDYERTRLIGTLKDAFKVVIDASASKKIIRIRVSFEDDEKFTSYTSKNHNIILPSWMKGLVNYRISKSLAKNF
jgi:hypothetical protein